MHERDQFPKRKSLPHEPPSWIDSSRETYFITVCCLDRSGKNILATKEIANPLIETVKHRNDSKVWWCSTFVVMPDHLHGLFRFPEDVSSMQKVIRNWKAWTAKTLGIRWQRDWFDHRLRSDESEHQKSDYILNNPVRAGLVEKAEDWPYRFLAAR